MPAPGMLEGPMRTFFGLKLGAGAPRFFLDFLVGGGVGIRDFFLASSALAASSRAFAVVLRVLYRLVVVCFWFTVGRVAGASIF